MRRSSGLLGRLLGISLTVTVLAVAGTAVGAALIVDHGVARPPDQTHAHAVVYGRLLAYAATHRSWRGAGPLVARLADAERVHIQLTDLDRRPLADGRPHGVDTASPAPLSVVDALNVNRGLTTIDAPGGIYPIHRNPLALTPQIIRTLDPGAEQTLACVRAISHGRGRLVRGSARGVEVVGAPREALLRCGAVKLAAVQVFVERGALAQVRAIATPCLHARGLPPVTLGLNYAFTPPRGASATEIADIRSCVTGARRVQLTPYVAPPALLLIGDRLTSERLSAAEIGAIAGVAALVLLIAVVITMVASRRVAQPMRALTEAVRADAPTDDALASGRAPREVAELAEAFDRGRRTRRELEAQRRDSISDIAHELRTPLSNIRAWLEARRDGLAGEDGVDARLLDEALTLQSVVDDLQLLSVAESGQLHLAVETFDLAELLGQVAAGHRAVAGPAIDIEVDAEGPLPVRADRLRLRRVLDNLMTNAIRAAGEPGSDGHIVITGRRGDASVIVTVQDSGAGVASEDLPRLFDRFWRADRSRSRASGGSGLGLAIARELVTAHGGTISVDSSPGSPTTFRITLPDQPDVRLVDASPPRRGANPASK